MKRSLRSLTVGLSLFAASVAHARELPNVNESLRAAPAAALPPKAQRAELDALAARLGGAVASIDERRGVPSFLWAMNRGSGARGAATNPEAAALDHLRRFAPVYGLTKEALGTARAVHVHDL